MLRTMNILPGLSTLRNTNLIAIIPSSIAKKAEEEFKLRTFRSPVIIPQVEISIVWHEMQSQDSGHQWLRGIIKKVLAQLVTVY